MIFKLIKKNLKKNCGKLKKVSGKLSKSTINISQMQSKMKGSKNIKNIKKIEKEL